MKVSNQEATSRERTPLCSGPGHGLPPLVSALPLEGPGVGCTQGPARHAATLILSPLPDPDHILPGALQPRGLMDTGPPP